MWPLFIFAGVLAAAVAALLIQAALSGGREKPDLPLALLITALVPLLSLGLYLRLGSPALPAAARTAAQMEAARARNDTLLGQRPFQILTQTDPNDIGALLALGELSARLTRPADAIKFYARALGVAKEDKDPRAARAAEALGKAYAAAGRTDEARQAFEYLQTLDPGNEAAAHFMDEAEFREKD